MDVTRWILISITFIIAATLIFQVYIWAEEYKHIFLYTNDFISYIMVFLFVIALTGIFKWFLKEEIIRTKKKRLKK